MAITVFNPTVTAAGRAAAIAADGEGLSLAITHISLGTGKYSLVGAESRTAMAALVETVTISGGSSAASSFRVTARFPARPTGGYTASEAGFWAGNPTAGGVLFAVWSDPIETVAVRSNIDYIAAFGLALSGVPGTVTVTIDTGSAGAIGLISAHESAADPHPSYALEAAVAAQFTSHAAAADPHPGYALESDVAAQLANHAAAADPHAGYLLEVAAATTYAPLASPTFTGAPAAPTAGAGTKTTQIATTEFVAAAAVVAMPPGAVLSFATPVAPAGWLKADGSAVSRTTFAALFSAIGTTHGAGNGSTTFNVPDLRGNFARGLDEGAGVDPGRSLGSLQLDALQNITGSFGEGKGDVSARAAATGVFADNGPGSQQVGGDPRAEYPGVTFDASRVARTADETRPRNIALLYCIKT